MSIPELGYATAFAAPGEDLGDVTPDERALPADEHVGCLLDCDRALGILAHGQARNSERRRLFLDAAGIGDDQGCVLDQPECLEIALRRQRDHSPRVDQPP